MKFGKFDFTMYRNYKKKKKTKFLSLNFKESFFNLTMITNTLMTMNFGFGDFCAKDEDVTIDPTTNKEVPVCNPELSYIIGTTSFDFNELKCDKIKLSDIYNYKNEEKNENKVDDPKKKPIRLYLDVNNETYKIDIRIEMCKLTLSPNFSMIFRVFDFIYKYVMLIYKTMDKLKFEQLRDLFIINNSDKNDLIAARIAGVDINKNKKNNAMKSREKSLVNIHFSIEGINLMVVVEPEKSDTHIIYMFIRMPMNIIVKMDAEYFYRDSKVYKIDYFTNVIQLSMFTTEATLSMYEIKNNFILINSKNKVTDNIDFSFLMNNYLDHKAESTKYDMSIFCNKETEFAININHVFVYFNLFMQIDEFVKKIYVVLKEEFNKINLNIKKEFIDDENYMRSIKTFIIDARQRQEGIEKMKGKKSVKYNYDNYYDMYSYDIVCANLYIKFYDIIDGVYQSLLEVSLKDITFDFYQNTNPKDGTNLVNYLKESFNPDIQNKKKFDTYDKTKFYMYLKIMTKIEIKSLNNYLNQWEYFIEPFNIDFYFIQLLYRMSPIIEIYIKNMININLSLYFVNILQFAITKITAKEEENKKKKEKEEALNLSLNDDKFNAPKYIRDETPVLIIENCSGDDMEVWFDNVKNDLYNKDYIIKIKRNENYEFTIDSLNKYNIVKKNNNFNSTISYKFCLEQTLIDNMKVDKQKLVGQCFNINYHNIIIHDISKEVKVSVECCSDNLLIRHIIFSSLISIKNETKFKDIEISNKNEKILLKDKKWQNVPISWLLDKNNKILNLSIENEDKSLIKNLDDLSHINSVVKFKKDKVVMCDIIKYKFNLDEYYKNTESFIKREEIFKTEINITSPIYLLNNTPYTFVINDNEKILSTKSISSYTPNEKLLLYYSQRINDQNKKNKNLKDEAIEKVIKDINFNMMFNYQFIPAEKCLIEKEEENNVETNSEGKAINNFYLYNKSTLILIRNDKINDYFICRLILDNPYKKISFNNKIYDEMKIELNSFRFEIIFDYYFVNKTTNYLFINNKPNDLIKGSKENILISSKTFIPFAKIMLNKKVKFRKTKKDWTDGYEYTALGKEFVLNVKNENKTYNAFSIMAKVSSTFKKSISFTMEEKFVVINELPFMINIKEEKLGTVFQYKPKEPNILLIDKETLDKKELYRVGIFNCYSHIFDPSKLGNYDFLIAYDKKIFDKYHIETKNQLIEYDKKLYFPIRCVINTMKQNTIYIIFALNNQYINQFKNYSPKKVQVFVNDNKNSLFTVEPEGIIPLVYINKDDKYRQFENINVVIDEKTQIKVSINELETKNFGLKKDYYIRIRPEKNNSVKSITLFTKKDYRYVEDITNRKRIKKYTTFEGIKILLNLEGIGFSLIDETPKELFYFSIYKIFLNYYYTSYNNIFGEMNLYAAITFYIKNMEIDYCLENAYDIIFNPTNQMLPPKPNEEIKKEKSFMDKVRAIGNEDTPFIQFVMSSKSLQEKIDDKIRVIYTIFPEIALIIQEFDVRINTILINCMINLSEQYSKLIKLIVENKKETDPNKINKEKNLLTEEEQVNINEVTKKLLKNGEDMNNLIINCLTLSAIKINTTFKINKNAIDSKYVPELFITVITTLCSTLTSFSDVVIKLNEFTFMNVFNDMDSLTNKLASFYVNKLLAQIYKVIFNMDLIGSPVNLVEGLGTGIFEFFNEPRKGLLKSPKDFGIGIAKGTRSLVSNIVGGGFKSASKITGTILNISKNISSLGTEEEIIVKEEEKPRGLLKGTLSGFKKGFDELASGFTGVVKKPIEQTKKHGATGFFKGLGSGLLGVVLCPVNSVLTVGNEVTSGISNSEFISNKKSLRRFRKPRTLYKYIPISPYNEIEEEEMKQKTRKEEGKENEHFSLSNELLYLENSTEIIGNYQLINQTILIFTDVMLKIMDNEGKKHIKKIYVCNIENIKERNDEIQLVMKNNRNEFLQFKEKKDYNNFIKAIKKYLK